MQTHLLHEKDLIVPPAGAVKSTYVPHLLPFDPRRADDICIAGGIMAPANGSMSIEVANSSNGWLWRYTVKPGREWEYNVRDEFRDAQVRAFNEFMRRGATVMPVAQPRSTESPDASVVSFRIAVDRLASSPFPGATLAKMMHDANIPVVVLQNQVIGPAWGRLAIDADEDLDGWHLTYEWMADDSWGAKGDRVAGQDAIDSWRRRTIEQAVYRYWNRNGCTLRAESDAIAMWERNWPPTTTDDMGRIVDGDSWPREEDDESL